MKKKIALITGVTGQDGSYLSEFLLDKGYTVHGIKRRASLINNTARIDHIYEDLHKKGKKFFLHYGDLTDTSSILSIIQKVNPTEIYNLAAQSHVSVSFEIPEYTADVNALGALRILEAIRLLNLNKKIRFYQASTSELFGNTKEVPQNENTRFNPRSPYAVSKLFSYWITKNYREAYGIHASNGILFNHESPRRGETFVTRKITLGLTKICSGLQKTLFLGNLNALRDWGHAKDYAEMQWLMLQQKKPNDLIISTNKQYSVRKFVEYSCEALKIKLLWKNKGLNEIGILKSFDKKKYPKLKLNQTIIKIDKKYYRPTEVENLRGNYNLAKKILGWKPKISLKSMVYEMIQEDMSLSKIELKKNDIKKG
jgi:GDPmannose 4,6-dehydratase